MILSGKVNQFSIPADDLYVWVIMVDLPTKPELNPMVQAAFSVDEPTADALIDSTPIPYGPQKTVVDGGLNMKGVGERTMVGIKGVSGSMLKDGELFDASTGSWVSYGFGGTNKIRFICRHATGVQHRLQAIFEIFR